MKSFISPQINNYSQHVFIYFFVGCYNIAYLTPPLTSLEATIVFKIMFGSLFVSLQITESFKKFGLSYEDNCVVVVTLDDTEGDKLKTVTGMVQGESAPLEELKNYTDEKAVKKVCCSGVIRL